MTSEGYSAFDEERWAPEPPKSSSRTAFQRDRARLIHSSALRRLGAKTQILVAGTDDFARTRLTHTLEVAQIGRQIGTSLGCDPDVVDCACLAHDLGHPPFGHNGERALAEIAGNIGGFEGNAQTLRLLTRLEPKILFPDGRSAGVNLTRAALDAAVKYPWTLAEAAAHPKGERSAKFCIYPDDTDVFAWLKQHAPDTTRRPVECQVMDLSDDIAYSVHDVEDAIATGAFNPGELHENGVIDAVVEDARAWYGPQWDADKLVDAFARMHRRDTFPGYFDGSRRALAALKNMTSDLIGRFAGLHDEMHGEREPMHGEEQRIVKDLVDVFMADNPKPSSALENVFLDDWRETGGDDERLRVAIDQVASLTDTSALTLHSLLC